MAFVRFSPSVIGLIPAICLCTVAGCSSGETAPAVDTAAAVPSAAPSAATVETPAQPVRIDSTSQADLCRMVVSAIQANENDDQNWVTETELQKKAKAARKTARDAELTTQLARHHVRLSGYVGEVTSDHIEAMTCYPESEDADNPNYQSGDLFLWIRFPASMTSDVASLNKYRWVTVEGEITEVSSFGLWKMMLQMSATQVSSGR